MASDCGPLPWWRIEAIKSIKVEKRLDVICSIIAHFPLADAVVTDALSTRPSEDLVSILKHSGVEDSIDESHETLLSRIITVLRDRVRAVNEALVEPPPSNTSIIDKFCQVPLLCWLEFALRQASTSKTLHGLYEEVERVRREGSLWPDESGEYNHPLTSWALDWNHVERMPDSEHRLIALAPFIKQLEEAFAPVSKSILDVVEEVNILDIRLKQFSEHASEFSWAHISATNRLLDSFKRGVTIKDLAADLTEEHFQIIWVLSGEDLTNRTEKLIDVMKRWQSLHLWAIECAVAGFVARMVPLAQALDYSNNLFGASAIVWGIKQSRRNAVDISDFASSLDLAPIEMKGDHARRVLSNRKAALPVLNGFASKGIQRLDGIYAAFALQQVSEFAVRSYDLSPNPTYTKIIDPAETQIQHPGHGSTNNTTLLSEISGTGSDNPLAGSNGSVECEHRPVSTSAGEGADDERSSGRPWIPNGLRLLTRKSRSILKGKARAL